MQCWMTKAFTSLGTRCTSYWKSWDRMQIEGAIPFALNSKRFNNTQFSFQTIHVGIPINFLFRVFTDSILLQVMNSFTFVGSKVIYFNVLRYISLGMLFLLIVAFWNWLLKCQFWIDCGCLPNLLYCTLCVVFEECLRVSLYKALYVQ